MMHVARFGGNHGKSSSEHALYGSYFGSKILQSSQFAFDNENFHTPVMIQMDMNGGVNVAYVLMLQFG